MGKQTRRKRQTAKKASPVGDHPAAASASASATNAPKSTPVPTSGPAILQRIRHADPLCRHAALSAVLHTMLDPTLLLQATAPVSPALLQAIREQIMGSHTECATLGAACLSNYVQYCSAAAVDEQLSAGWMLLLTGRLQQCVVELQKVTTTATATAKTASSTAMDSKQRLKWLQLTQQCLQCTCSLTENNPVALQRLISTVSVSNTTTSRSPQLRNDSLAVWLQLAQLASSVSGDSVSGVNDSVNVDPVQQDLYQSIHLLAVRCLHSAWDDNAALLLPWMREQPDQAKECLETLLQTATGTSTTVSTAGVDGNNNNNKNNSTSTATRLHAAGAWLAAWSLVSMHQDDMSRETVQWARPLLLDTTATDNDGNDLLTRVVHVLCLSGLEWKSHSDVQRVVKKVVAAWSDCQAQQADDALEQQVVSSTDQKKEPARQIARRMKQQKEQEKDAATAMQEDNGNDNDDAIDNDNDDTNKQTEPLKRGKLPENREDRTEVWEQVQAEWHDLVRPVQLALEISANLTSTGSGGAGAGSGDNTDMQDDDEENQDDEEQDHVMMDAGLDEKLTAALIHTKLPDQILLLLGKLVSTDWMGGNGANDNLPDVIRESCSDLQNKAGTCLGHCLAALPEWTPPASLWLDLKNAMHKAANNNTVKDKQGREGISSAMVVALQSRESIRTQMQSGDLDFLLQLLKDDSVVVQRDAVCMLGILCSQEEHPADVNQKTCQALLQALTAEKQSAMVLAEVLSVLMDIYGDDDCHPTVFEALDVLGDFQRSVPLLKQRISVETTDADPDDVEQWKETALNASRFIAYKKNQL